MGNIPNWEEKKLQAIYSYSQISSAPCFVDPSQLARGIKAMSICEKPKECFSLLLLAQCALLALQKTPESSRVSENLWRFSYYKLVLQGALYF